MTILVFNYNKVKTFIHLHNDKTEDNYIPFICYRKDSVSEFAYIKQRPFILLSRKLQIKLLVITL